MATTSSNIGPDGILDANDRGSSCEALEARGLDMRAFFLQYISGMGAAGIRVIAQAVNEVPLVGDAYDQVETLGAYEHLKSAVSARQADLACAHEDAVVAERKAAGVQERNPSRGIGSGLALVLQQSPNSGIEYLNLSRVISRDLPFTRQGVREGKITYRQAEIIARSVRHLKKPNQAIIDSMLFNETHTCFVGGDAMLRDLIRQWALILEPVEEANLEEKAMADRYLNVYRFDAYRMKIDGLVPLEYGAAVSQVFAREVGRARAAGDERNQGKIAADHMFTSLAGIADHENIPFRVGLVMTDRTLLGLDPEPALMPGYGYISAGKARKMLLGSWKRPEDIEVLRLFTAPKTGDLMAMDSKARVITGKMKLFILYRDQYCRTPGCSGRINEIDHVTQAARGGPSCVENLDGRCRTCNQTKESPGWVERTTPGDRHTIRITTSSLHTHTSVAPPLPGTHWKSRRSAECEDEDEDAEEA